MTVIGINIVGEHYAHLSLVAKSKLHLCSPSSDDVPSGICTLLSTVSYSRNCGVPLPLPTMHERFSANERRGSGT